MRIVTAVLWLSVIGALSNVLSANTTVRSTSGLRLLYAEDKSLCHAVDTYLRRIANKYPRQTVYERRQLLDPFLIRYRDLLPPVLTVPTPVAESGPNEAWGGVPHFALYSVVLDPASGDSQLIAVNDKIIGRGYFSYLFILKPGVEIAAGRLDQDPPPDIVVNSISDARIYRSVPDLYFFEKLYGPEDRKKPLEWRIYANRYVSLNRALRLFARGPEYFVLAGHSLFGPSIVWKITHQGEFLDLCYFDYRE